MLTYVPISITQDLRTLSRLVYKSVTKVFQIGIKIQQVRHEEKNIKL